MSTPIESCDLPTGEQAISASDVPSRQEQESQLVEQARAGGKLERDNLMLYLYPLIEGFARRYTGARLSSQIETGDLVGEAYVAMLSRLDLALSPQVEQAIPFLLGVACSTIRREIARSHSLIPTPYNVKPLDIASLDAPPSEDFSLVETLEDSTFSVLIQTTNNNQEAIHNAIRALKDKERAMVVRHFGLYVNAPEPIRDILRSLGSTDSGLMTRTLTRLRLLLADVYPQYCSLTRQRKSSEDTHVSHKPLTPEQEQRLRAAQAHLEEHNLPVTYENLKREAHMNAQVVGAYYKRLRAQTPQISQEERLNRALTDLQEQGENITINAMARRAHVHKTTARVYLHMKGLLQEPAPVQTRIAQAYKHLLAQGEKVTKKRLQQMAHVGSEAVGDFLRRMCESERLSA